MVIVDDIALALPELQANAESLMTDSCTVKRPTGVVPDANGYDVVTYSPTLVYSGKCKRQDRQVEALGTEAGSTTVSVVRSEVHVPVGSGPFVDGDVVFFGDVPTYRILATHAKTWQTAMRLPAERVS